MGKKNLRIMIYIKRLFILTSICACLSLAFSSCSKSEYGFNPNANYDIIQVNGENYACFGYRCAITYETSWDLSTHRGMMILPCGKLSYAEKGEYDFDYMYAIYLEGQSDLKKGSKLEDFSPTFECAGEGVDLDYASGSATVENKKDDKYITVKFESLRFKGGNKSYTLKGTVQLKLDED